MIEPTETESKEKLDDLISIFRSIKQEAEENPEIVKSAPNNMPVQRLDQVHAARFPILTFDMLKEIETKKE